jgi:hypothetical protein
MIQSAFRKMSMVWVGLLLGLAACQSAPVVDTATPPAQTPLLANAPDAALQTQGAVLTNEAIIDEVDFSMMETFPVQVNAIIQGRLPDSCTTIDQINQTHSGDSFLLTVSVIRRTDAMCTEQPEPFDATIPLDVEGLPAGSYTVVVTGANSATNFFALTVDNIPPAVPSTPVLLAGTITGLVWEDDCRHLDDGALSGQCVPDEAGEPQANGVFEPAEARLAGVTLILRPGNCTEAETPAARTTTAAAGTYFFTNLPPGTYCVQIDATEPVNSALLLPGHWTYPGLDEGSVTLALEKDGYQTIDFGWDREEGGPVVPTVTPQPDCDEAITFGADVTVPDDTVMTPGEAFVKTWRVRNEGSCTWGPGYQWVFAGGDQLSAPARVPLAEIAPPGNELDLSVPFIAPLEAGAYRSEWLLQDPAGNRFGGNGSYPFYVQIGVE